MRPAGIIPAGFFLHFIIFSLFLKMWAGVSKGTVSKVKRQHMAWEKIFANHISDMGLSARLYKEFLQLNNNKNTTQLKHEPRT